MNLHTITVWDTTTIQGTAAQLTPGQAVRHHRARDLYPGDYRLLSVECALALLDAGLGVRDR
mgnify:CR=1 FL=1